MVFAYYHRLSAALRRTYRKSDTCTCIALGDVPRLRPRAEALEQALLAGKQVVVRESSQGLIDAMVARLRAPPVRVRVLTRRPHDADSELQRLI